MLILFKVIEKDTRTMSVMSLLCLCYYLGTNLILLSNTIIAVLKHNIIYYDNYIHWTYVISRNKLNIGWDKIDAPMTPGRGTCYKQLNFSSNCAEFRRNVLQILDNYQYLVYSVIAKWRAHWTEAATGSVL